MMTIKEATDVVAGSLGFGNRATKGGNDILKTPMNSPMNASIITSPAAGGLVGGGKLAKRDSKKRRKGAGKSLAKKAKKSASDKSAKKWVRTLRKHRTNDGTVRTIWKNVQTGDHAVRRVRVLNGVRKGVYTKI
jgi:hypothetical protein